MESFLTQLLNTFGLVIEGQQSVKEVKGFVEGSMWIYRVLIKYLTFLIMF